MLCPTKKDGNVCGSAYVPPHTHIENHTLYWHEDAVRDALQVSEDAPPAAAERPAEKLLQRHGRHRGVAVHRVETVPARRGELPHQRDFARRGRALQPVCCVEQKVRAVWKSNTYICLDE